MRREPVHNGTSKDLQGGKRRMPKLRENGTLCPNVQDETAGDKQEQNKHPEKGKCSKPKKPLE